MTNYNQELYNAVMALRGDDILDKAPLLIEGLGKGSSWRDASETDDHIKLTLGVACQNLTPPGPLANITDDGPPDIIDIIDIIKWKIYIALNIEALKKGDDLTPRELEHFSRVNFLNSQSSDQIQKFSDNCNFDFFEDLPQAELREDLKYIKGLANTKVASQQTEMQNKHLQLYNDLQSQIEEIDQLKQDNEGIKTEITNTLRSIDDKISYLRAEVDKKEKENSRKTTKSDLKKANKKAIKDFQAKIEMLKITKSKLDKLRTRMLIGTEEAIDNTNDHFKRMLCKVSTHTDYVEFNEGFFRRDDFYGDYDVAYEVKSGFFEYKCLDAADTLGGRTGSGRVISGKINLASNGLSEPIDITDDDTREKILKAMEKNNHKFYPYPAFAPGYAGTEVEEDDRQFRSSNLHFIVADIKDDLRNCQTVVTQSKKIAENPQRYLHNNSPTNAFVDVISLADMQNFDERGEPYFHDEIVDKSSAQVKTKDARTRFSIEGGIATRGITLHDNEIKRSTYYVNEKNPKTNKIEKKQSLVVETSYVQTKSGGRTVQIVTNSKPTDPNKLQLLAFKMAKERLLLHKAGDPNDKIVLHCNGNDPKDRELASYIYAALLMLTSTDEGDENYIAVSPRQIEINGENCEKPGFWQRTLHSKRDFYQKYFGDKGQRDEMREEVTHLYREKRKSVEEGAEIKDDAGNDTYTDVDYRNKI